MDRLPKYLVLVIAGIVISQMILGDAFWHPNDYLLMDGGGGYVIYFNAFYHVNYGSGTSLTGMNYPDPECIFMTDAQGVLAIILQWIGNYIPIVKDYVVGTFHVLFVFGIIAQLLLLFEVLERLKIQSWMAVVGAILIGSLAPQFVRIYYGHFGLAYPFVIPLAILFLLQKRGDDRFYLITGLSIITFLLFGLNNPYLLVAVSLLILTYGFLELSFVSTNRKEGIIKMAIAMSMLVVLYTVMAALDSFDDRIHQQWGHFYFASKLSGIFSGSYSLQYDLIIDKITNWEFREETLATISMASIIGASVVLLHYLILKAKNKSYALISTVEVKLLLGAALIIFLYSSAMFQDKHWKMLISQIDFITMIKASGRLSWISYYILSISGFLAINKLLKLPILKYLSIALMILWSYEGYRYISDHCKTLLYQNHLTKSKLDEYISPIESEINLSHYQGILTIPASQSWNDNLLTSNGWISEPAAFKIASATGIPLINSRLSRAPVQRSLDNIQMTSHPIIRKKLVEKLNPERKVLLVRSKNYTNLSTGEKHLLSVSNIVYEDNETELYEYTPSNHLTEDFLAKISSNCDLGKQWYYYNGLDQEEGHEGFMNQCIYVDEEWKEIIAVVIPDTIATQEFELSVWSRVNVDAFGMPFFNVKVFDENQQQVMDTYIDSRNAPDTQHGWLRTGQRFTAAKNYKIVLKGFGRYKMDVDEVMIRPVNANICQFSNNEELFSINNYLID